jgi:hypothetical protein
VGDSRSELFGGVPGDLPTTGFVSSPGTEKAAPHFGHLTALPAGKGAALFRLAEHEGQETLWIDM